MKFSEKIGSRQLSKQLNFIGDPDHRLDTGIVYRTRYGRYGKWLLKDINLLVILNRQMAVMVRCALAEVCTVPVLL